MATRMQQRRGTAAQWTAANPILNAGEIGWESDTNKFKIGDGVNHWADLTHFYDAVGVRDAVDAILDFDDAPELLDTIRELAQAINNDPDFLANVATIDYVDNAVAGATLDVATIAGSGIEYNADTEQLDIDENVVQLRVDGVSDQEIGYLANLTSGVQEQLNLKQGIVEGVSDAEISYLANVTGDIQSQIDSKVASADIVELSVDAVANALTTASHTNITVTYNDNAGTISLAAAPGYSDENAQDAVGNAAGLGLSYDDSTGSISVNTSVIQARVADVSDVEIGYLANVTSDIQTQLNSKASSTDLSNHESDTTNIHGIANTAVLVTLDGSQTLTNKTLTSPSISSPSGLVKGDVGLGNVDNTSDANKPVSNATQSALDLKAPLASPTFTGTVTLPSGTVTSGMIADGTIVNADINASAAIALSKLATDPLARANHTGTQTASTISDFDTQVRTSRLDQMAAPTASVSLNSQKITGLATPTASTDAVTKAYVDSAVEGLHVHPSVKAATTTNVALASALENGDTLDGVTLATGDRILVKNQTTKAENGIYVVQASGQPSRATDFDTAAEVDSGDFVFVDQGTTQGNTGWVQINTPATIGTDAIEFVQFSGAGTYTAGTGLTLTGTVFSINTGTTVDLNTAQTLTNKTINLSNNTLTGTLAQFNTAVSNADLASLAGTETLTNKTINLANNTVTGTIAQFNTAVSDADLATIAGSETLTNKTLTSPTLTTPRFGSAGEIDDSNGNELIKFPATVASAVNEITVTNAATGNAPSISATGDNADISLNLVAKGTGTVQAGGVPVVTATGTQTLTNKTLTSPVISTISNTGTVTLPTATDTLVGRATTDTLTNKTINGANNTLTVRIANDVSGLGSGVATFLATPSSANLASAVTDETGSGALVFGTSPTIVTPRVQLAMNAQTGTTYTLALADASNRWVTLDNTSAITVTIPPSTYSVGDQISIQQTNTGQVTIQGGSGVTVTGASATPTTPKIRTRYASAVIICTGTNTFTVIGDLV